MTTAINDNPPHANPRSGFVRRLSAAASSLIADWYGRYRLRADLSAIDDHLLCDIGLSREDVRRECEKAFWR